MLSGHPRNLFELLFNNVFELFANNHWMQWSNPLPPSPIIYLSTPSAAKSAQGLGFPSNRLFWIRNQSNPSGKPFIVGSNVFTLPLFSAIKCKVYLKNPVAPTKCYSSGSFHVITVLISETYLMPFISIFHKTQNCSNVKSWPFCK